uniref:tRNA(Ile)-lysidine synthase n=2 Tax=Candidatus Bipolaricaulota TaxID=67810 RepID=H5SC58_9BACT|nr:tRNA(Ile)-lysidine synthetase [uncultured Acetothermia bacterium]BAL59442.1 tRNA(Ile)-lysidine synthetase [Candidatus Acetothermum autotrophicum]
MLDQVRKTIARYQMLQDGDYVLVAVSGGVDSVVLLHVLTELKRELKLSLAVAHFDHGIRPNSAQDAEFVKKLARSLRVRFYTERGDVPAYAKAHKISLEVAARSLRYQFLEKTAQAHKFKKIALGHTLNDQAETLLMRLLRGSGLEGLAGIPPVRSAQGYQYIRPLIECTREQIESFARAHTLCWREDPTNYDMTILRNKIRHELIPALREYNPKLLEALGRTARLLGQAAQYLEREAEQALDALVAGQNVQELILDLKRFLALPEYLQALVLRRAVGRVHQLCELEAVHIEAVVEWASRRGEGELHLPAEVRVLRRHNQLIVTMRPVSAPQHFEYVLTVPGETIVPETGWRFTTKLGKGGRGARPARRAEDTEICLLDADKIQGNLVVRNRRPGDRICLREGTKKLQDFFVDKKIPREARDALPLICDENTVIWIVGQAVNESYRATPRTRRILEIIAERI